MERRRANSRQSNAVRAADIRAILPSFAGCKRKVNKNNTLICNLSFLVYPFTQNYMYVQADFLTVLLMHG